MNASTPPPGPGRARTRSRAALLLALPLLAGAAAGASHAPEPTDEPCLRLETDEGAILLRLSRAAAPRAVEAIERLARGPIWNLDLLPRPEAARSAGYFEGLAFDYARPHLELRLPARAPEAAFTVEAELDGVALGLDRQRVADVGEATERLQQELLPALQRPGAERASTPRLEEWRRRFEEGGYDASFLVGKSRQELLEAIGFSYRAGLASLAPTRGAVALVPVSPTEARLSLSILLADHPARTGKWVVVGRVVGGLEIAEAISLRPYAEAARRDFRPAAPALVRSANLLAECASAPEGGTP